MKYETLGSSSLQISRIVHGCMELGGGPWDVRTDAENAALLRAALEHGVTAFDTAESYGGGHSEEVVGAALAPVRDKVVLCTKVSKEHLHKADVLAACEGSLRRLKTDYIDLYRQYPFDLVLSGHTHGGQVRIPLLVNGLFAPDQGWFPRYAGGLYEVGETSLVVSRGLSYYPRLPRVFNPPEVVVIDVEGTRKAAQS